MKMMAVQLEIPLLLLYWNVVLAVQSVGVYSQIMDQKSLAQEYEGLIE